jgi:hypothetical protein
MAAIRLARAAISLSGSSGPTASPNPSASRRALIRPRPRPAPERVAATLRRIAHQIAPLAQLQRRRLDHGDAIGAAAILTQAPAQTAQSAPTPIGVIPNQWKQDILLSRYVQTRGKDIHRWASPKGD